MEIKLNKDIQKLQDSFFIGLNFRQTVFGGLGLALSETLKIFRIEYFRKMQPKVLLLSCCNCQSKKVWNLPVEKPLAQSLVRLEQHYRSSRKKKLQNRA